MSHKPRRGLAALTALSFWMAAGAAAACTPPPPASAEEVAARVVRYQQDRWTRSDSVYLALATNQGSSPPESGPLRIWTELTPVLQLKGRPVTQPLRIEQTGMSSCGPVPYLEVLLEKSGGYYLVYSTSQTTEQDAIIATVRVRELVEPRRSPPGARRRRGAAGRSKGAADLGRRGGGLNAGQPARSLNGWAPCHRHSVEEAEQKGILLLSPDSRLN